MQDDSFSKWLEKMSQIGQFNFYSKIIMVILLLLEL